MERVPAKLDELTLYKKPKADSSKTVTIVSSGTLVWEALKASEELKSQGVESFVFNASTVNRGSLNEVFSALEKSNGRLVTLEDHQVMGGMGSLLVHRLSEMATTRKVTWPMRVKSLGVQGKFGQSAYKASELYAKHGMDAKALVRAALELV